MTKEKTKPRQNRLSGELSPYLLQHALNPVDWYPWGEEALARARAEDKPIFLSIGYATCHWCHVMAHESFEDEGIAARLRETAIAIKVDREERPDLDHIYMNACHLMTGGGGWPLTVLMTPDQKPFFAATYLPRETRYGQIGLRELLSRVSDLWRTRRADFDSAGQSVAAALARPPSGPSNAPGEDWFHRAASALEREFDHEHGGFGSAPKFPMPHKLLFLLRWWRRRGGSELLAMVTETLTALRRGGIYDQLGHGFHRYSTDAKWQVPHFEKMLYDQALLILTYLEAFEATREPLFAETARETIGYVLRELRLQSGGFMAGEDADMEGEEGKSYVWTEAEIRALLPRPEVALDAFSVSPEGTFSAPGVPSGACVLRMRGSIEQIAHRHGLSPEEARLELERARAILFKARRHRPAPARDDKVLTDWNGLMIAALARASVVLGEPEWARAAGAAIDFVRTHLVRPDGRLLHRAREVGGIVKAGIDGTLDDTAFLLLGLLEQYEATFDPGLLSFAAALAEAMIERFSDRTAGGFFLTADDAESLLVRPKSLNDGAIPSGNAAAHLALLRLGRMLSRADFLKAADDTARAFGAALNHPLEASLFLVGLDEALGSTSEIVIAGEPGAADTRALLEAVRAGYDPAQRILVRPPGDARLDALAPHLSGIEMLGGRATAYVCNSMRCSLPTADPEEARRRFSALPAAGRYEMTRTATDRT